MKPYDPKTMSLKKLGAVGTVPVMPMFPIGAQMVLTGLGIKVHYKVDEEGHYLNGALPSFPPSRLMAVKAAVASSEDEASYSDTGQTYKKLIVKPDPKHSDRFLVKAGAVLIGFGVVDKDLDIVSTDEPLDEQAAGGDDDSDDN
jgi:hypothetical protein